MRQIITTSDIRDMFTDIARFSGPCENGTIEIINASFIADDSVIFGELNEQYAECELHWYRSQSLNIHDMPCNIPSIWKEIASTNGEINSNYGWCVLSEDNHRQLENAINALILDPTSRQAVMIYTRPSMHSDAIRDGMRDFMCTNNTQLLIRGNRLHYIVNMRSNDAVFGYKNDKYWHDAVHREAMKSLKMKYPDLKLGDMWWNAGSLHVYERHFNLIPGYKS